MNKHWRISLYGTDSDKRCSIGYHIELPKVKRTKNHSIFKKGKSTMPLIHVHMFSGRTPDQKRNLVHALTDAFVQTAGSTPDAVDVILVDV